MEIWKVPSGRNRSGPKSFCPPLCAPSNQRWASFRSEARTAVIRLVRPMATTTATIRQSKGRRGCGVGCVGRFITNRESFGWAIFAFIHAKSTVC